MPVQGAKEQIHRVVVTWQGIKAVPHRFGGAEYRLGDREIGHVHGNRVVDIPFPKPVRDKVIADGRAEKHQILPESGWVSVFLREVRDIERAISLLRVSYDLAVEKRAKRASATGNDRDQS